MIRSQKRIPGLIGLIVAVLLMAVVIKLPVRAAADDYSGSNWMSGLDDSRYLYEINLPGTNNSGFQSVVGWYNNTEDKRYPGADSGAAFILTQNQGVYEQLKSGVRFLDLGLSDIGPEERSDQLT